jgi:spore germination protein
MMKWLKARNSMRRQAKGGRTEYLKEFLLSKDLNENIARLKDIINNPFDLKDRVFKIAGNNTQAAIMFIEDLVNEDRVFEHILKPLIIESTQVPNSITGEFDLKDIKNSMMSVGNIQEAETFDTIVQGILSGDTLIMLQGHSKGLLIGVRGYQGRTIGAPETERSVKGPQESFVEILKVNIGLIRRRLRDPNLTFELHQVGRRAKCEVVIAYNKGIADKDIVDEVRNRLTSIDTDDEPTVTNIGYLMTERPNSIFPLNQVTERPDKVVAALDEGRVAILPNGSPGVLIVPVTLPMLMQSTDDYFENWIVASVIRVMRYIALFVSSLFPALYISITSYNPGMLPTNLLLSIAATRAGVPFPAMLEAFLMEFTLELLQEAGLRLPKVVGQTVSIVGGLVIGQAAVQAGVVSPIMVIVISVTAVASYTIPDYSLNLASRILRIPFMILAVTFGSFGIVMGILMLITYLSSLTSYGIRYLSPITPYRIRDWKDTVIRAPLWTFGKRPEFLYPEDTQRQTIKRRREKE